MRIVYLILAIIFYSRIFLKTKMNEQIKPGEWQLKIWRMAIQDLETVKDGIQSWGSKTPKDNQESGHDFSVHIYFSDHVQCYVKAADCQWKS